MEGFNYRAIGITLICVGVAPLAWTLFLRYSRNWEPLRVPIALRKGEYDSPEFKIDRNGRYIVNFYFDKLPDFARQQCLMGIPLADPSCDESSSTELDWQIVGKGAAEQSGSYKPLSFSGTEVTFATFNGKRGDRRKIVLNIKRNGGELNAAHPMLIVRAGPEYWENIPTYYRWSLLWVACVGGIGLLVLIVSLFGKSGR